MKLLTITKKVHRNFIRLRRHFIKNEAFIFSSKQYKAISLAQMANSVKKSTRHRKCFFM